MESRVLRGLLYLVVVVTTSAGCFAAQNIAFAEDSLLTSFNTDDFSVENDLISHSSKQCEFESIGRELAIPPRPGLPIDRSSIQLPAVPTAVSMTLFGFLCVSFVRDRRAWFAVVAGLLWIGQAGIHIIPELNQKFSWRVFNNYNSPNYLSQPSLFFSFDGLTGNSGVTRFIGLLRMLEGIPGLHKQGMLSTHIRIANAACDYSNSCRRHGFVRNLNASSKAFVLRTQDSERFILCPTQSVEHFVVFTPAFIFGNLSRGPPVISRESLCSRI